MVGKLSRVFVLFLYNPISWTRLLLACLIATVVNPIKYRFAKRISRYERAFTEIILFLIHPVGLIYFSLRFKASALNSKKIENDNPKLGFEMITNRQLLLEARKLGEIDKDGLFVEFKEASISFSGKDLNESLRRKRSKIEYFTLADKKIVRKEYTGAFPHFRIFNELRIQKKYKFRNLIALSILQRTIYLRYQGESLHSLLTRHGANLKNEELYYADGIKVFQRDLNHLKNPIIEEFLKFHYMGVTLYDLNYANILIDDESQTVSFVDFESARIYRHRFGSRFMIQRDRDREKLNQLLASNLTTYLSIRSELQTLVLENKIYAPISLGYGLCTPGIFDRNLGFGKFHYAIIPILRRMPHSQILSLGTNNSSLEILIAAKYGSAITCLEISEKSILQAKFFLSALEWSLNKELSVEVIKISMESFNFSQKRFDLVLSLCSIYYLEERAIRDTLIRIAQNSENLIMQLNTARDIGRDSYRDYEIASPEYFLKLLPELNFVKIKLYEWKLYSRPVIAASAGRSLSVKQLLVENIE